MVFISVRGNQSTFPPERLNEGNVEGVGRGVVRLPILMDGRDDVRGAGKNVTSHLFLQGSVESLYVGDGITEQLEHAARSNVEILRSLQGAVRTSQAVNLPQASPLARLKKAMVPQEGCLEAIRQVRMSADPLGQTNEVFAVQFGAKRQPPAEFGVLGI